MLTPVKNVKIVPVGKLTANDYNPNKVNRQNLELLKVSILANGWTSPIVVRPNYTIIDGFHRWMLAQEEPLKSKLNGKVPIVIVSHEDEAKNIYGTITHNRARGIHLLEPMKSIVKKLLDKGKTVAEISKQLGMRYEEIYRLTDFTKEDFLKLMVGEKKEFSNAKFIIRY